MDEAIKLADRICIMSKGKLFNTIHRIIFLEILPMILLEFIGQNRLIQDRPNRERLKMR